MFRNTGLDDDHHVRFAAQFGELDDVTPNVTGGRAHRLSDVRLFDVSNIDLDGMVFPLDNVRRQWNKVSIAAPTSGCLIEISRHLGKRTFPCRFELQPPTSRLLSAARTGAATSRHGRRNGIRRCTDSIR